MLQQRWPISVFPPRARPGTSRWRNQPPGVNNAPCTQRSTNSPPRQLNVYILQKLVYSNTGGTPSAPLTSGAPYDSYTHRRWSGRERVPEPAIRV